MDKKNKKKDVKHMPRRGEQWEDSSKDPVPVFTLGAYYSRGNTDGLRGYTCTKRWEDKQGNPHEETIDVPLLKFAEPGMKLVDATNAVDDEPEKPKPEVMVKPIKNGLAFICPGLHCGDKHEFVIETISTTAFLEEYKKRLAEFHKRHDEHMLDGTLYGNHQP